MQRLRPASATSALTALAGLAATFAALVLMRDVELPQADLDGHLPATDDAHHTGLAFDGAPRAQREPPVVGHPPQEGVRVEQQPHYW